MSDQTPQPKRGFFSALLHADDPTADSIVLTGLIAIVSLAAIQAYDVAARGRDFSAVSFGTAAAAIIGAVGAGKKLRDG